MIDKKKIKMGNLFKHLRNNNSTVYSKIIVIDVSSIACTVDLKWKWQNVPQVWSTPSFKALKRLNLFDLR